MCLNVLVGLEDEVCVCVVVTGCVHSTDGFINVGAAVDAAVDS